MLRVQPILTVFACDAGHALETMQDAMIDGEKYFRLPLLPWRRILKQAQHQMAQLQTVQKKGIDLARRADSGTLVWSDVKKFQEQVDDTMHFEWYGSQAFAQALEVLQSLLRHLVLAMHVEGAFDLNGEVTIKGAQRAVQVAIEKGLSASSAMWTAADGGAEGFEDLPSGAFDDLMRCIRDQDAVGLGKVLEGLPFSPQVQTKIQSMMSMIGPTKLQQLVACLAQMDPEALAKLRNGSLFSSSILHQVLNNLLKADTPMLHKFVTSLTEIDPAKLNGIFEAFASGSLTKLDMGSLYTMASAALPPQLQSVAARTKELIEDKIKTQLQAAGLSPAALATLRQVSVEASSGASLSNLTDAVLLSLSAQTNNPVVALALEGVQHGRPNGLMVKEALSWAVTVAPPQQREALVAAAELAGEMQGFSSVEAQQLLDALMYVNAEGDGLTDADHQNSARSVTAVVQVVRSVLDGCRTGTAGNFAVLSHVVDMFGSSLPDLNIAKSMESMQLDTSNQVCSIQLLQQLDKGQLVDAVLSLVRGKLGQDGAWGQHAFSDNFKSAFNWIDEFIDVTVKREVQGDVGCPSESFDVG